MALLLLAACSARASGGEEICLTLQADQPQVVFPSVIVDVELAATDAERARGLGGHEPLGPCEGMLFIFERPDYYAFWMKGMAFPIDIMWIQDGQVVHLEQNVPPPAPGTADFLLPIYSPSVPAAFVLEVRAGFAAQHEIAVGTPVSSHGI
jgi:uncharacterized protein